MIWLLVIIWIPLVLCFGLGAALATTWWLWRGRSVNAEYEKRRLSAEAESDRLRLRISSLKEAEARADDLAIDLEQARANAARLPKLEKQIADLKIQVGLVAELENQVINLRARADDADRLEREVAGLRHRSEQLESAVQAASDSDSDLSPAETPDQDQANVDGQPADTAESVGNEALVIDLVEPGHTDDLKVIKGIGPALEAKLNALGIRTWEQLAHVSNGQIEAIGQAIAVFPGRIKRDRWVEQAGDFVARFPLTDPYHRPTAETMRSFE